MSELSDLTDLTTLQYLREARKSITAREDWWDGGYGLQGYGGQSGNSKCAEQALRLAAYGDYLAVPALEDRIWGPHRAVARAMDIPWDEGEEHLGIEEIFKWNDSHTHAEVLAAFDRAIQVEEALEAEHDTRVVVEEKLVEEELVAV